jgi:hypothetical protein
MAEFFDKPAKARNFAARVTVGLSIGHLSAVVLENELIRMTILAGRGADVIEFLYKPKDLDFAWQTATGVRGNALPSEPSDDVASFMDEYPGGWQTIFPNGGPPSHYAGATFGQHAEVAVLPWEYEVLEDSEARVSVRFFVKTKKIPFLVEKIFTLVSGSAKCEIEEQVTNLSEEQHRAMWGFHFTFGAPFLALDSHISIQEPATVLPHMYGNDGPIRRVGSEEKFAWPFGRGADGELIDFSRLPKPETPGEMLYLQNLSAGWYRIDTPSKAMAVEVSWDKDLFPHLWYWQEYGYSKDAPWFGKHYNIGLEPFSSFPTNGIAEAIENGSALTFAPHEVKRQLLTFEPIAL